MEEDKSEQQNSSSLLCTVSLQPAFKVMWRSLPVITCGCSHAHAHTHIRVWSASDWAAERTEGRRTSCVASLATLSLDVATFQPRLSDLNCQKWHQTSKLATFSVFWENWCVDTSTLINKVMQKARHHLKSLTRSGVCREPSPASKQSGARFHSVAARLSQLQPQQIHFSPGLLMNHVRASKSR